MAPPHGLVGACALTYRSTCSVTCAAGHVRHRGDETRTCLLSKQWSGEPPTCRGQCEHFRSHFRSHFRPHFRCSEMARPRNKKPQVSGHIKVKSCLKCLNTQQGSECHFQGASGNFRLEPETAKHPESGTRVSSLCEVPLGRSTMW